MEIVWLRQIEAGTPNAYWVVCNKNDPNAVKFIGVLDSQQSGGDVIRNVWFENCRAFELGKQTIIFP